MLESNESGTQVPMGEDPWTETDLDEQERKVIREYGMVLTGRSLMAAMGYPSLGALRQAIYRDAVTVPLFPLENRRGMGAMARDVARWQLGRMAAAKSPK